MGKSERIFQVGDSWIITIPNSPYYYRKWYDPAAKETYKESLGTTDLGEAKKLLIELALEEQTASGPAKPESVLLQTLFDRYWKEHGVNLRNPNTAKECLAFWAIEFDGLYLNDLTVARAQRFIDSLKRKGFSIGYVQRIITAGKAAINHARKTGVIELTPYIPNVQTMRQKRNAPPKGRPIEIDEFAHLFVNARSEHLRVFMMIMGNTLCRPDAALDLGPDQIDFRRNVVDLNPDGREQTNKFRPVVPLTETLRETVSAKKVKTFVNFGGESIKSIKTAWRGMIAECTLPKKDRIKPYSIRHTMARALGDRDISDEHVGLFLGHLPQDERAVTAIYKPYKPGYLHQAKEAVEMYWHELEAEIIRQDRHAHRQLPTNKESKRA